MKFYPNGAPGTDLWYKTASVEELSRIANSLERIAKCLEDNNQ